MSFGQQPALTARALLSGALIGAALTPCNVYSGLKIGWSFNMSIASALLALAFWRLLQEIGGARPWGMQENVVNQTTASSAASIVSGGLVAPIPALALLGGPALGAPQLVLWVFSVSILGVAIGLLLHARFIARGQLAFPAGTAAAETLRNIHGDGSEARRRVRMLAGAAALSGFVKLVYDASEQGLRIFLPGGIPAAGALLEEGLEAVRLRNLGFALDGSLLMIGFGAIIGLRAGLSLLAGAIVAWLLLAPWALARGWADPGAAGDTWFGPLVEWLLWPGVALMTAGALTSLAVSWRQGRSPADGSGSAGAARPVLPVPLPAFAFGATAAVLLVLATQYGLHGIGPGVGLLAVGMAVLLAVVAARVVGETGIPPIGALGKISQLGLGAAAPGNVTANLMGANVTGGAAGQTADLLNDLKAGWLLQARPGHQAVAQVLGVLVGSIAGSLTYLLLIPDPQTQLLTEEWPAPAVATWKAVAEVFAGGVDAMPTGAITASVIGAAVGIAMALLPARWPRIGGMLPSPTAMGLAFVIPAWIAIALCLGAVLAAIAHRWKPAWSARYVLAIAAGLVAGESLTGVGHAAWQLLRAPVG